MRNDLIEEYRDNGYVTGLPEMPDQRTLYQYCTNYDKSTEEERTLPPFHRLQKLGNINRFMVPLGVSYEIAKTLDLMILESYRNRKPGDLNEERYMNLRNPVTTAPTCTIIGESGCGKTTLLEHLLSRYPQKLPHDFGTYYTTQLVWMRVQISEVSGPKLFYLSIFREMDRILGTDYYNQYSVGRWKVETLRFAVEDILKSYHVGLIVIDEAQNLFRAFNRNKEDLAAELTNLLNNTQTAFVFCGTEETKELFRGPLYSARRIASFGQYEINKLSDKAWDNYIEHLWKFQYTSVETPICETFKKAIYQYTSGNMALTKTLYTLVQEEVIGKKDEEITLSVINRVATTKMKGVSQNQRGIIAA